MGFGRRHGSGGLPTGGLAAGEKLTAGWGVADGNSDTGIKYRDTDAPHVLGGADWNIVQRMEYRPALFCHYGSGGLVMVEG